jgi:hypothetical protein
MLDNTIKVVPVIVGVVGAITGVGTLLVNLAKPELRCFLKLESCPSKPVTANPSPDKSLVWPTERSLEFPPLPTDSPPPATLLESDSEVDYRRLQKLLSEKKPGWQEKANTETITVIKQAANVEQEENFTESRIKNMVLPE